VWGVVPGPEVGRGDRGVALIAAAQRGLVTTWQLRAVGLSSSAIARRVQAGRLHPLYRSVYLVGHPAPAPLARELGAILACGVGSFLSHRTAGTRWGFLAAADPPLEVVVRTDRRRRDFIVHRVRRLELSDVTVRDGLPVTTPARTLLDLAQVLGPRPLQRALEEAERLRLVTRRGLAAELRQAAGRPGVATLASLVADGSEPALTRSEAEERMLALIRKGGLPTPRVNAKTAGHEVDFLWPDHGLVLEVDGYAFHSGRAAFERDRLRDADLAAIGLRVVRTSWRQLTREPEAVLVRVAQALAAYTRRR
jgi:very-short-patch-repair endonuclease